MHFQLSMGLSVYNPIVSEGRSVNLKALLRLLHCSVIILEINKKGKFPNITNFF